MKFRQVAAALVLASAPMSAFAQARYTPVLSTSMQRTCAGETGTTMLFDATGQTPLNQPQTARDTRTFRATRSGDGYLMEQGATTAAGDTVLRANVSPSGAVSNAQLSGSAVQAAIAASSTPVDVPALANSLAQEIPERMIINRSFAVGDHYYPDELRTTLISQMTQAMGVPFPVTGSIDIRYTSEITQNGRRAHVFDGSLTIDGAGQLQGQPVSIALTGPAHIVYDADTGLIVEYRTGQEISFVVSGQMFQRSQHFDNYTCTIAPQ